MRGVDFLVGQAAAVQLSEERLKPVGVLEIDANRLWVADIA
jgi:hypothetical protein